jgi:hypothetical protein
MDGYAKSDAKAYGSNVSDKDVDVEGDDDNVVVVEDLAHEFSTLLVGIPDSFPPGAQLTVLLNGISTSSQRASHPVISLVSRQASLHLA